MQDVDTAFLNKSDLEANVDALTQEIEFLKALYLEVRLIFSRQASLGKGLVRLANTGITHLCSHSSLCALYVDESASGEHQGNRLLTAWHRPGVDFIASMIQILISQSKDRSLGMSLLIYWPSNSGKSICQMSEKLCLI
jgi:hypothetical protein